MECRGAIANARALKASKIFAHFFRSLLWLNAFSLSNQIHNSQLLLVCPNNVWLVTQGVKLKAQVFASWGNQQQVEHPMEIAQIIHLCHNQGWCETHINGRRFQSAPMIQPTTFSVVD